MSDPVQSCVRWFAWVALGALSVAGAVQAEPTAAARKFYRLESSLTIPSPHAPSWDYLAYDASHGYVYIARRDDGILIYDTKAGRVIGALENTIGGNATTLVPELDRAFVTNGDGSLTIVQLSTLKTLDRVKVGESADNSFYDPVTQQLMVTMGDDQKVKFVDARTGKITGDLHIDSESIEGSVADGHGNFYTALRDRNKLIRIDARAHRLQAEFAPANCVLPNSLAFDAEHQRVLLACRGDKPALFVLDANGRTLSSSPIGHGNDVMIFDPASKRIFTANGFDATLVILDQVNGDSYKLSEALTTRPYARTMALDPQSGKLYLVYAEGTVDPSRKWKSQVAPFYPNTYFRDTFTLLTYSQR